MKKIISLIVTILMSVNFVACNQSVNNTTKINTSQVIAEKEVLATPQIKQEAMKYQELMIKTFNGAELPKADKTAINNFIQKNYTGSDWTVANELNKTDRLLITCLYVANYKMDNFLQFKNRYTPEELKNNKIASEENQKAMESLKKDALSYLNDMNKYK